MLRCPHCEREVATEHRFCWQCGHGLVHSTALPLDAELRQLTVLFCDLAGSTQLAARLDTEDFRDVLRVYQRSCEQAITAYDGHLAQYLGDGILAYFGFPKAHEASARRAARAALQILTNMQALAPSLSTRYGIALQVRVGIHTGRVVMDAMGNSPHRLAIGETPNIAAALQAHAPVNAVLLSEPTAKLCRGDFQLQALPPFCLRDGLPAIQSFQLLGPNNAHDRMVLSHLQPDPPFVGRENELAYLQGLWRDAALGRGQSLLLRGEAGIGKTRLVRSFVAHIEKQEGRIFYCTCSSFERDAAWRPFSDLRSQILGPGDDDRNMLALADLLGLSDDERHALPILLGIAQSGRHAPPVGRAQVLATFVHMMHALAERQPLILVIEDLHWSDRTTQEALRLLGQQRSNRRLLVLGTARLGPLLTWQAANDMLLGPLSDRHAKTLVQGMLGAAPATTVVERIVAKAQGNPLFVEELTRMHMTLPPLFGSAANLNAGLSDEPQIPATLHDSLLERLDRLGPAKALAQTCAAIGRTFDLHVLCLATQRNLDEVQVEMDHLCQADVVCKQASHPAPTYAFKHALVQEIAYASLTRRVRKDLHRRLACALAQAVPSTPAHVLARHAALAGDG